MTGAIDKSSVISYNYPPLSQLFSAFFLGKLLEENHRRSLSLILKKAGIEYKSNDRQLSDILEDLYKLLQENYRCEYVYKNIIANRILFRRHSLNDSILLTEFRAGTSNADVVIFNGTSSVYEIKTELDNFGRLGYQMEQYHKVFDKIYVVTCTGNIKKITEIVGARVGILALSASGQLRTYREAISNKKCTDPSFIFDSLRRAEYESIIEEIYGYVPDVPNTMIYTACRELFIKLSPAKAHDSAVKAILKFRGLKTEQKKLVENAPDSMKLLLLSREFSTKNCLKIESALASVT